MSDYNVLREYYVRYLTEIRGNSDKTVSHYLGALKTISRYLVDHGKLVETIYEVDELTDLIILKDYLYSQPDFVQKDERGNRMYSAGLNNYIRFAQGEEFSDLSGFAPQMDIIIPVGNMSSVVINQWKRNGIIKKQSIEMAKYVCECDSKHITFIAASTGRQYMEGHHIIMLKNQMRFKVSLDVYANIVCVCPICHRLLHYGLESDKRLILYKLYAERADRLAKSGIVLSKDEFLEVAI